MNDNIVEDGEFELWAEMQDYSSKDLIKYLRKMGYENDWIDAVAIEEFFRRISLGIIKPTDLKPKLTTQYERFADATPIECYFLPNWSKFYKTGILEKSPDWQEEMNGRFDYFFKDDSIEKIEVMIKKMQNDPIWHDEQIKPLIEMLERRKKSNNLTK